MEGQQAAKEWVHGQNPVRCHIGAFRRSQSLYGAYPGQAGTPSPGDGLTGGEPAKKFALPALEIRPSIFVSPARREDGGPRQAPYRYTVPVRYGVRSRSTMDV